MRLPLLCLVLAAATGGARCDSLWKAGSTSLFTDRKAGQVGDLVTIIVTENVNSTQQANTGISKKSTLDSTAGIGPILKLLPKLGFSGSATSTAQGSTSQSASLAARMTAKITEVKLNGILTIEGTHSVVTNKDTQMLRITGTIRARDIAPDNTVPSSAIADAHIELTGRGPIAERQKPGVVNQLLKWLF